jgi:PAS domain S-box-containing protein
MPDRDFLARIGPESQFHVLFDALAELCMFAKDVEGRLRVANRALLRRLGLKDERELLGKTDFDLLPRGLAEKYRADDRRVMATRKPLLRIVELFLDTRGIPTWHVTNKFPVFSRDGEVLGVMGTIEREDARSQPAISGREFIRAYEHIKENCAGPISLSRLAARGKISLRQFERRFRERLRMSPRELIMRMRVDRACDQLRSTRDRIAEVALACGFYDQAVFTRQFKKQLGMTPAEYRRTYG